MIAAVVIPAFDLRAALRLRPGLETEPAALAPLPGTEPLIGSVTAAAEAKGVRPGMRLGEALATCPQLVLVEQDPATVEQAWEEILRRLEDAGFAVEPAEPGTVLLRDERASSGSTAGSSRRSSGRSQRSGRRGTRVPARPSGASRRSRRRTSRGPGRR